MTGLVPCFAYGPDLMQKTDLSVYEQYLKDYAQQIEKVYAPSNCKVILYRNGDEEIIFMVQDVPVYIKSAGILAEDGVQISSYYRTCSNAHNA